MPLLLLYKLSPVLPENDLHLKLITRKRYLTEAVCWVAGITLLATFDPTQPHIFSLCPFSWLLEHGCPGCGLGHAIAFLFRGEWGASWQAHPLAVPALLLLTRRVFFLLRNYLFLQSYHQKYTTHG